MGHSAGERGNRLYFVAGEFASQNGQVVSSSGEFGEIQRLFDQYRDRSDFEVPFVTFPTTYADLITQLSAQHPTHVHFSGHGEKRHLILHREQKQMLVNHLISDEDVLTIFRSLEASGHRVELAFFNTCNSATLAKKLVGTVRYAIGTAKALSDVVAREFARLFYQALVLGHAIPDAYGLARAGIPRYKTHAKAGGLPRLFGPTDIRSSPPRAKRTSLRTGSIADMTPPVLIVHHSDDTAVAERIQRAIQEKEYPVWRSERDVLVDDNLHASVSVEMGKGGPIVLCLGPRAVGEGLVRTVGQAAMARALQQSERYLIPVLVAKCDARLHLRALGAATPLDCTGAQLESGIRRLLESLQQIYPMSGRSKDADFDTCVARYLEATREAHRFVPIVGAETCFRLDLALEQVYIPLTAYLRRSLVEPRPTPWSWEQVATSLALSSDPADQGFARDRHAPHSSVSSGRDVPLERAFSEAVDFDLRAVVIVGNPGSGKTTLLKRLLVQCIDEGAESLGLPKGTIPVLLPLRQLGDHSHGIEHFIRAQLRSNPHLSLPVGFESDLVESRPLLLLLDGLDEVADATVRVKTRLWIEAAVTARRNWFFAVTSRYAGYRDEARFQQGFLELYVRPFEHDQIRAFIERWYAAVERHLKGESRLSRITAQTQAAELWNILSSEEFGSRQLRGLITNPLLLTILCFVHQTEGALPRQRVLLYQACVRVLLEHWRQAKKLALAMPGQDARRVLQPLAYWLHQEEERLRATAAELASVLREPLRRIRRQPEQAAAFLEDMRDQSGLLVGWDVDSYGFMHSSFQEYLTALELRDRELLDEAVAHFGQSWWREVILLLLGLPDVPVFEKFMRKLVWTEQFVRYPDLVAQCLEESSEVTAAPFLEVLAPDAEASWETRYAALRALKGMDDPGIVEACRRLRSSRHAPLRRLAQELLAARGASAVQRGLSAGSVWVLGDTGLEFLYVPEGSFSMGDPSSPSASPVRLVTFLNGYWIGKYPVTNQQYRVFLRATGRTTPIFWDDSELNAPEQPVVGITREEALQYCAWAGSQLRRLPAHPDGAEEVRLPSEAEWEYAARGPEGGRFPWGDEEPSVDRVNFGGGHGRTTRVGAYPAGESWVGALDMSGNVWERCQDNWHENYAGAPVDGRAWTRPGPQIDVIRGGGWDSPPTRLNAAQRLWVGAADRSNALGFRVVCSTRWP